MMVYKTPKHAGVTYVKKKINLLVNVFKINVSASVGMYTAVIRMHRIQGYKIFEQINKQTDLFQSRVFSSE
jgi:hypothetical protein